MFFNFIFHRKHVGAVSETCWSARFLIRRLRSHYGADPKSPMQNLFFIKWEFKGNLHTRVVSAGRARAQ